MQTYTLGNSAIEVVCDDAHQQARLDALWRTVFSLPVAETSDNAPPAFRLHLKAPASDHAAGPTPTGPVSQTGPLQGWQTQSGFFSRCGESVLDLNLCTAQGVGMLHEGFWAFPLAQQREFFLVALLMIARQYGLYGIHANGLSRNGAGVLLVGDSGSGKTTLTLALVRNGWHYVADDTLLLQQTPCGIQALALRRGFSCKPQTLIYLADAGLAADGPELGDGKQFVALEQVQTDCFAPSCSPRMLLFPTITGGADSRLEQVADSFALATLVGLSTGILIDRSRIARQMMLLQQLVQQAHCYRLLLGDDVFYDAPAVSALLQERCGLTSFHGTRA